MNIKILLFKIAEKIIRVTNVAENDKKNALIQLSTFITVEKIIDFNVN